MMQSLSRALVLVSGVAWSVACSDPGSGDPAGDEATITDAATIADGAGRDMAGLAVRVDNSNNYVESTTGVGFEWTGKAFNRTTAV